MAYEVLEPEQPENSGYEVLEPEARSRFDTQLSPEQETEFQSWKQQYAPNDSGADYDLRGAFKAGLEPAENGHWPDTYKKPNHPTFSDQSVYAKDAPDMAGKWDGEKYVPNPKNRFATLSAERVALNADPLAGHRFLKAVDDMVPNSFMSPVSAGEQAAVKGVGETIEGEALARKRFGNSLMMIPGLAPSADMMREAGEQQTKPASQVYKEVIQDPGFRFGKGISEAAEEAYPVSERDKSAGLTKVGETIGSFAPMMATGPLAPIQIGLQSAGAHMENDYAALKKTGLSDEDAAKETINRATESGLSQATVFLLLPKPLKKVAEKLIIDKLAPEAGASLLRRFVAGRAAMATEMGALLPVAHLAENVINDRPLFEGVGEAAASGVIMGGLTPGGLTERERAQQAALGEQNIGNVPSPDVLMKSAYARSGYKAAVDELRGNAAEWSLAAKKAERRGMDEKAKQLRDGAKDAERNAQTLEMDFQQQWVKESRLVGDATNEKENVQAPLEPETDTTPQGAQAPGQPALSPAEWSEKLDYRDVTGMPVQESASQRRYAEALSKQSPAKVGAIAIDIYKKFTAKMQQVGLPVSDAGRSQSWKLWDIGKQLYYLENPKESSGYRLANPLTDSALQNEIVDRMVGWEIVRSREDNGDKMPSSKELTRIGAEATKNKAQSISGSAGLVQSADAKIAAGQPLTPEETAEKKREEANRLAMKNQQDEWARQLGVKPEAAKAPQSTVAELPTIEAPLDQITLSEDVPQFKAGADEKGVTKPLGGKFDRKGVAPIQLWRRLDGRLEVISGRHRFELAQRTGEKTIPAQVHDEADGFTARAASRLDAELNIRDEQGEVSDYANYFRDSNLTEKDAQERGLLARGKGKAGFRIARAASEDLFALHQSGRVTDAQAEAIAASAPLNASAQRIGIKFALEGKSPDFVSGIVKGALVEAKGDNASLDLFGNDDAIMQRLAEEESKAEAIRKDISAPIWAVSGAVRKPELAKKLGVDVKDPKAVKAKLTELRQQLYRWENWRLNPDLVAQVRGELKAPAVETAEVLPGVPTLATLKGLPVYSGAASRKELFKRFGLPNAIPTGKVEGIPNVVKPGGSALELFVDDENGGNPIAYHTSDPERLLPMLKQLEAEVKAEKREDNPVWQAMNKEPQPDLGDDIDTDLKEPDYVENFGNLTPAELKEYKALRNKEASGQQLTSTEASRDDELADKIYTVEKKVTTPVEETKPETKISPAENSLFEKAVTGNETERAAALQELTNVPGDLMIPNVQNNSRIAMLQSFAPEMRAMYERGIKPGATVEYDGRSGLKVERLELSPDQTKFQAVLRDENDNIIGKPVTDFERLKVSAEKPTEPVKKNKRVSLKQEASQPRPQDAQQNIRWPGEWFYKRDGKWEAWNNGKPKSLEAGKYSDLIAELETPDLTEAEAVEKYGIQKGDKVRYRKGNPAYPVENESWQTGTVDAVKTSKNDVSYHVRHDVGNGGWVIHQDSSYDQIEKAGTETSKPEETPVEPKSGQLTFDDLFKSDETSKADSSVPYAFTSAGDANDFAKVLGEAGFLAKPVRVGKEKAWYLESTEKPSHFLTQEGRDKLQAPPVAEAPSITVKKDKNFETNGEYHVTDGKNTARIYRDPENKWWYDTKEKSAYPGAPPLPLSTENRADAIKVLQRRWADKAIQKAMEGENLLGFKVKIISAEDAERKIKGYGESLGFFHTQENTIYLVRDNLTDAAMVREVVREEVGHGLLRTEAGRKAFREVFEQSRINLTPEERQKLIEEGYEDDASVLMDEFIAKSAREDLAWWKEVVEKVKAWLASKGLANLSNDEVARLILRQVREQMGETPENVTGRIPKSAAALSQSETARLNRAINKLEEKPDKTAADHARLRDLQAELGQLDLLEASPLKDTQAEAADSAAEIARRQQERLIGGNVESQADLFGKPGQQDLFGLPNNPQARKRLGVQDMVDEATKAETAGEKETRMAVAEKLLRLHPKVDLGDGSYIETAWDKSQKMWYTARRAEEGQPYREFESEATDWSQSRQSAAIGHFWIVRKGLKEVAGKLPENPQALKKQTETPEFKKWFGESRVVDGKGEPLVVFHGGGKFNAFDTREENYRVTKRPDGFAVQRDYGQNEWEYVGHAYKTEVDAEAFKSTLNKVNPGYATDSPDVAASYAGQFSTSEAEIKPLYIKIEKPLDLRTPEAFQKWTGIDPREGDFSNWENNAAHNNQSLRSGGKLLQRAFDSGYDGIFFYDTDNLNHGLHTSYAFFDARQAKLAPNDISKSGTFWDYNVRGDGNSGDFNPGLPDIAAAKPNREQLAAQVEASAAEVPRMASEKLGELRGAENNLTKLQYEGKQFRSAIGQLRGLAELGKTKAMQAGQTVAFSPLDKNLKGKLEALGIPARNVEDLQQQIRIENRAVSLANKYRRLEIVNRTLDNLKTAGEARFAETIDTFQEQADALNKGIERAGTFEPGENTMRESVFERAKEIRETRFNRPDWEAKRDALAFPEIQEAFVRPARETQSLLEQFGAEALKLKTVAEDKTLSPEEKRSVANGVIASIYRLTGLRRDFTAFYQSRRAQVLKRMTQLRAQRATQQIRSGLGEVLLSDAIATMGGERGLTGDIVDRQRLESLRETQEAVKVFARSLQSKYGTNGAIEWSNRLIDPAESTEGSPVTPENLGVSQPVFENIRWALERSPEFADAVQSLVLGADKRIASLPLTQLENLEELLGDGSGAGGDGAEGDAAAASAALARIQNRATRQTSDADAAVAGIDRELYQLGVETKSLDEAQGVFDSVFGTQTKPNRDFEGIQRLAIDLTGLGREMVVDNGGNPNAIGGNTTTFRAFGTQPEVVVRATESLVASPQRFGEVKGWFDAATDYLERFYRAQSDYDSGVAEKSPEELGFDRATVNGLEYAIIDKLPIALDGSMNVEATRIDPNWAVVRMMGTKFWRQFLKGTEFAKGREFRDLVGTLTNYTNGRLEAGKVMGEFSPRIVKARGAALASHPELAGNLERYQREVFTPMGTIGRRQFSPLEIGTKLGNGQVVTKGDMELLRLQMELGRKSRDEVSELSPGRGIQKTEAVRGVRFKIGDENFVRRSGSVGQFGLPRHESSESARFINDLFESERVGKKIDATTNLGSGSDNQIVQFWNKNYRHLVQHVLDVLQPETDRIVKREALMQRAEEALAKRIYERNGMPELRTMEDVVNALSAPDIFPDGTGMDARSYVREQLARELGRYRVEVERRRAEAAEKAKSTGFDFGSGMTNEFTSPANKLWLPSSLFEYGAVADPQLMAYGNRMVSDRLVEFSSALDRAYAGLVGEMEMVSDGKVKDYAGNLPDVKRAADILGNLRKDLKTLNEQFSRGGSASNSQTVALLKSVLLANPNVGWRNVSLGQLEIYMANQAVARSSRLLALLSQSATFGKSLLVAAKEIAVDNALAIPAGIHRFIKTEGEKDFAMLAQMIGDVAMERALTGSVFKTGFSSREPLWSAIAGEMQRFREHNTIVQQEMAAGRMEGAKRRVRLAAKIGQRVTRWAGTEVGDIYLNYLAIDRVAALHRDLEKIAEVYGKNRDGKGDFNPQDAAWLAKPEEVSNRLTATGRQNVTDRLRLLLQKSNLNLEQVLWDYYQGLKSGKAKPVLSKAETVNLQRAFMREYNASDFSNRPTAAMIDPTFRLLTHFQGYSSDFTVKLMDALSGSRGQAYAQKLAAALPTMVALAATAAIFGQISLAVSKPLVKWILGGNPNYSTVFDKEWWTNPVARSRSLGFGFVASLPLVGDAIGLAMNLTVGNRGFSPSGRILAFNMIDSLVNVVRGLTTQTPRLTDKLIPAGDEARRWLFFYNAAMKAISPDYRANMEYKDGVSTLRQGMVEQGMDVSAKGGQQAGFVGSAGAIRRINAAMVEHDPKALETAFAELVQYHKDRGAADPERSAFATFSTLNPSARAGGNRKPTADELQAVLAALNPDKRAAVQKIFDDYTWASDALGKPEPTFERRDSGGGTAGGGGGGSGGGGGASPTAGLGRKRRVTLGFGKVKVGAARNARRSRRVSIGRTKAKRVTLGRMARRSSLAGVKRRRVRL